MAVTGGWRGILSAGSCSPAPGWSKATRSLRSVIVSATGGGTGRTRSRLTGLHNRLTLCTTFIYIGPHLTRIGRIVGRRVGIPVEAMNARWISVAEIARHQGVARDAVYRRIDSRGMPTHRVGRFWKFQLSEVDAWIKSGEADASNSEGPKERIADSSKQEH